MTNEVEVNDVLKYMRELIGNQAQEIAVLKATLEAQTTANS
jgi:hypothetical protein